MKKMLAVVLMALFLNSGVVFADHRGQCSVHGAQCATECAADSPCPITSKFFKKAHFLLANADEIGLSEDQVKQIQALKTDVMRQSILDGAQMQVFTLDVQQKMSEDKVDVEGLSAMIDQGTQSFAASGKKTLDAYVKMKSLLSADQLAKAKAVWKGKDKPGNKS